MSESVPVWQQFNWFDWVLVVTIGLSMLISLVRGFVKEVISLLTWGLAIWVTCHYTEQVSILLVEHISNDVTRMLASVGLLFFATLIGGVMINAVVSGALSRSGLSFADRMLGVVFGAGRGLLVGALVVFLGGVTMMSEAQWWSQAKLVPYFERGAVWIAAVMPEAMVRLRDKEQAPETAQEKSSQPSSEIAHLKHQMLDAMSQKKSTSS